MLAISEAFNFDNAMMKTKEHLVKNKDYYMLGGGLVAGGLGLKHLMSDTKQVATPTAGTSATAPVATPDHHDDIAATSMAEA